jgi:hypothetical protein
MSVWMTPELKPVYGGTYYPPDDRYYGQPGFKTISELHLRGRIVSIDADTFTANRRLQHLDLKNGQLRRLSVDAFQSLRKLRLFDLSSNQLVQLPPGLFDP